MELQGIRYLTASALLEEIGVSRQTLWRWRQSGKIPAGQRFRDGRLLFSETEVEEIRDYANRLEPAETGKGAQMKLFEGR